MRYYVEIPACRGVYVLVLRLAEPLPIRYSGRNTVLGPGIYAYVGSARGPGGLRARIKRHVERGKTIHWHIDQLTEAKASRISLVAYACIDDPEAESRLARACQGIAAPGPKGFGCSDRRGDSTHLYILPPGNPAEILYPCFEKALGMEPRIIPAGSHEPGLHNV